MKRTKIEIVTIVAIVVLICSCARSSGLYNVEESVAEMESMIAYEEEAMDVSSPSDDLIPSPKTYISSSAALENPNDTTRNMIRTANLKFKVKDVINTTYRIENIAVQHDGFVENSKITSQINSFKETRIKEDSVLVTTYYSILNSLILRVPNTKLDTMLKEIAQFVEFMDYRVINATDVTFDLLSKKLEQDRLAKYDSRMRNAVDNQGRKLMDVTDAENNILNKQRQADESKVANLQILDKIRFSTITLSLYQEQNIKYEVIAKEKIIKPYTTPFGVRLMDAFKFGWKIVVEIFLLIINIWPIILIAGLAILGVNFFKKRTKKVDEK